MSEKYQTIKLMAKHLHPLLGMTESEQTFPLLSLLRNQSNKKNT